MTDVDKMYITFKNIEKAEVWVSQVASEVGYVSENRDLKING